jgi:hypothetical protein
MPREYTTREEIENYTLTDIASGFSAQLSSWIQAVTLEIERYTDRIFIADAAATARVYDGEGIDKLLIDDCVQVTEVATGNDSYGGSFSVVPAGGSSGYITLPANNTVLGRPIQKILSRGSYFIPGQQNQRITAKWGYSVTVPADIRFAATVMVAGIINAQRKDNKEVASEKIGNYSVSYSTDKEKADYEQAKTILQSYRRYSI